jgi:hypothetical protein
MRADRRHPVAPQRLGAEVASREQEPHEAPARHTILFGHVAANVTVRVDVTVGGTRHV